MSDILDVICTSVSVPRPRFVAREELPAMLREPDNADNDKASLADPLFAEIAICRIAEFVQVGLVRWADVARAAATYGFGDTGTGRLACEMSA